MSAKETSLTIGEARRLKTHEETIEKGVQSFIDVGKALMAIRDERLYTDVDDTFEGYCKKRWAFTSSRARQIIDAAKATSVVESVTIVTPANEAQARVLASLPDEQTQATVWVKAVETAPKNDAGEPIITAAHVQRVANEAKAKVDSPADEPAEDEPEADPTAAEKCEADNRRIESFCRSLVKFYETNVPKTAWTQAEGRIASALSSVRAGCNTLRSAKAEPCPKCDEGEVHGKDCAFCAAHGYLPTFKARQIAEVG